MRPTAVDRCEPRRDEDEHDEQPDHDDGKQRNDEFHVRNATTGV